MRTKLLQRGSAAFLLATLATFSSCGGKPEAPRPDVVLLVIDTLRADRLGCYGYPRPTSPTIDALAAEGVVFENALAQASWTLVSMTSLWGGRYITEHLESPRPEWTVLAEVFQNAGYATLGRSANPLLSRETAFARGFDDYDAYGKVGDLGGGYPSGDRLIGDLWEPLDRILEASKQSKTGEDGERAPLFLYLQPFDPHAPYMAHPEYDAELPVQDAPPLSPAGWHAAQLAELGPEGPEGDPRWSRDIARLRAMRGLYEQEIRFLDRQLEVLFEGLRERGVLDNAIIAIVSDHGEGLWDHITPVPKRQLVDMPPEFFFYGGHGYTLYQEAIHTPFVLHGAGVPRGVRVAEPVENIDLFPTLLHLTGLAPPDGIDGRTLVPAMHGQSERARRYTFAFVRQSATVLDHETGLKLVRPTEFGRSKEIQVELFHLPSDPEERTNLAGEKPAEVERLSKVLEGWELAHPTRASDTQRTPEQIEELLRLGYTDVHTPGLDPPKEPEQPRR